MSEGIVKQVMGPVVDVEFPRWNSTWNLQRAYSYEQNNF